MHKTLNRYTGGLVAMLLLLSISVSACGGQETAAQNGSGEGKFQTGEPINDPALAAIVVSASSSDTLTTEALEAQFRNFSRAFPQVLFDPEQANMLRHEIVDQFVNLHLLIEESKKREIQVDALELQAQMAQLKSDTAYYNFLVQQGITDEFISERLEEQLRIDALIEVMAASADDPSDAEIETFRQERSQEINAQHILFRLSEDAPAEEEAGIRRQAQAVLDSARAGTDFSELATRHSEDPGSAEEGGDLGYFGRGSMVPEFEEAAFALQESGAITPELVRTAYGFHIIRLQDRRMSDQMDTAAATQALTEERRQEAVMAEINKLREVVTVRLNQAVMEAPANGGGMQMPFAQ